MDTKIRNLQIKSNLKPASKHVGCEMPHLNCQSKYKCCGGKLKGSRQKKIWFDCNLLVFKKMTINLKVSWSITKRTVLST